MKSDDPENLMKISEISQKIAEDEAQENRDLIMENFKDLSENPEKINMPQMWKLCKSFIWPILM